MTTRRTFLRASGAAVDAFAALRHVSGWPIGVIPPQAGLPLACLPADETIRIFMADALTAAKGGGASYADVRVGRYQNHFVITREQQIVQVIDTDSIGGTEHGGPVVVPAVQANDFTFTSLSDAV